MYCRNCGNVLNVGVDTCPYCGCRVDNSSNVVTNNVVNQNMNNQAMNMPNNGAMMAEPKKSNNRILLMLIILLLVAFLVIMVLLVVKKYSNKENEVSEDVLLSGSRTVMIYASPTNLESEVKGMTTDLKTLSGEEVDLDNVNVLLYTGGTEYWHNFIQNDENAIYILKEDGFEKLESYEKKNMSDPDTLEEFLDYAYKNYKTDLYDLIIYDHGNALQGAVVDDFNENDILTLDEFDKALSSSPFKDEKLEMILFRTCLMGNAEVAATFAPYANYLLGSEEVTWIGSYTSVLDFLNDVEASDTTIDFGKKFIESYEDFMAEADPFDDKLNCYSIIDLRKIDELFTEIDNFFEGIDLDENYNLISRKRATTYQFGTSAGVNSLDVVDLYDFVSSIGDYSTYDVEKVINALEDAIVYNWTNTDDINGLSIYFPYNASNIEVTAMLKLYDRFDFGDDYNDFINDFYEIKRSGASKALTAAAVGGSKTEISGDEFKLQLTSEQVSEFAGAAYYVFRKMDDEYYMPVFASGHAILNDDGVLQSNITNKIIRMKGVKDDNGNEIEDAYLQILDATKDGVEKYQTFGVVINTTPTIESKAVTYTIVNKDGVPTLSNITANVEDIPEGILLNPNDYAYYDIMTYWYKIFDKNGNYTPDWESYSTYYGFETKAEELELEFTSLSGNGEYYCIFKIVDIYGKVSYSKPVKLDK